MASSSGASSNSTFDHLFKILLVGDSGVGKSSVLLRFTQNEFEDMSPTIGVDFKLKMMNVEDKRLKLTIWDTAGQERFRTLTSSYYRGAHGIIFVYDVTRPDSFRGVEEIWMNEVESYSTLDAIKIVIGNKVDKEDTRKVTREEVKFSHSQFLSLSLLPIEMWIYSINARALTVSLPTSLLYTMLACAC